ncbi:MAG: hypothetical protein R6U78_01310 [Bacteroidales bacterium]
MSNNINIQEFRHTIRKPVIHTIKWWPADLGQMVAGGLGSNGGRRIMIP